MPDHRQFLVRFENLPIQHTTVATYAPASFRLALGGNDTKFTLLKHRKACSI
jgi:hypothetical protein